MYPDPDDIKATFKLKGIVFENELFDVIYEVMQQNIKDYAQDLWLEHGISVPYGDNC